MITVANCFDFTEANHLRMVLESAGIPAFVPDEMTAMIAPHWFLNASGIRLQVSDQDAAEAQELIKEARQSS